MGKLGLFHPYFNGVSSVLYFQFVFFRCPSSHTHTHFFVINMIKKKHSVPKDAKDPTFLKVKQQRRCVWRWFNAPRDSSFTVNHTGQPTSIQSVSRLEP